MNNTRLLLIVAAIVCFIPCAHLFAQWSGDPSVNTPICTAENFENDLVSVSDSAGGAIFAWTDYREISPDSFYYLSHVYAQRVNSSGIVQWTTNGVALVTDSSSFESLPKMVSDGAGGAILVYQTISVPDFQFELVVQRINASGAVLWSSPGVNIGPPDSIYFLEYDIASDGAGGAIVSWTQFDDQFIHIHVFAQRINPSGGILWGTGGVMLASTTSDDDHSVVTNDGAGGAIISWTRYDDSPDPTVYSSIYAQHIHSSGTRLWNPHGVPICTANTLQDAISKIASDGLGGAIIAWSDYREDSVAHIFANHINGTGAGQWFANGAQLSSEPAIGDPPEIVSDNAGGAIVSWANAGAGSFGVRAQRINISGGTLWASGGILVAPEDSVSRELPILTSAGAGSAIITWADARNDSISFPNATHDIYAQQITPAGSKAWGTAGVPICTAQGEQQPFSIIGDLSGGAIVSWLDPRNTAPSTHVYAQRVIGNGSIGPPLPPLLTWRPNGSINQPTSLILRWHRSTGTSVYDIDVSTDSTFPTRAEGANRSFTTLNVVTTSDTFYIVSSLAHTTTYFWHVRASNDLGTSAWSGTWKFTTAPAGTPEYAIRKNWNLVSVPLLVADPAKHTLYPFSSSELFSYDANTGYVIASSLGYGRGYWLRFDEDQSVPVIGTPFTSIDDTLAEGWNLVGTISNTVSVASVSTDPPNLLISPFWGYAGSYVSETVLQPGKAYWIKTNGPGILHLSSAANNVVGTNYPTDEINMFEEYNNMTFIDAGGNSQTLFFGTSSGRASEENTSALPPLPPTGSFDVRFSSQRCLEIIGKNTPQRFPISISTEQYPVSVRWNVHQGLGSSLKIDGREIALHESGEAKITDPHMPIVLTVAGRQTLPAGFSLEQNYPNPFNPATVIRYQLPVNSMVKLKIYNTLGQEVRTLVDGEQDAGYRTVQFDATPLPSGIFFYKLTTPSFTGMKKMVFIR